jgi:nucleotide-binding universal stress UspA family protein
MLPTIQNILYLTDLSKHSAYVFRYAVQIAQKFDAKITILHVLKRIDPAMEVPILVHLGEEAYQKLVQEQEHDIIDGLQQRLHEFAERELQNDPKGSDRVAKILVHEGDPVAEMLEAAETIEADLVVMGDHSKGILAHTFLGSTTERLLRHIRRPVLVVPIPKSGIQDLSV